jgi:hypothetical protein
VDRGAQLAADRAKGNCRLDWPWITAAEANAWREEMLRTDPAYRARYEAAHAERRERAEALRRDERPIVHDLRHAGYDVGSVWDLVNTSEPYPDALPVLLAHLERGGYLDGVMESLGRALAVRPAAVFWDDLFRLYTARVGVRIMLAESIFLLTSAQHEAEITAMPVVTEALISEAIERLELDEWFMGERNEQHEENSW